jgi:ElaB/YqjD/DUF883 family membrane-anchored ribosome-binding protein
MNTETLSRKPHLTRHLQDVRRGAENVVQDLKGHAQEKLQDAKDQANARFQGVKEETTARIKHAKTTARDVVDSVRGFVAEHPFAAFGFGIGLGILLGSRMRR